MLLTVDASVTAKWFFDEPLKEYADALLDFTHELNAPELLVYEFTSIVRKYTRHNKITETEGMKTLERFQSLSIHFYPVKDLYKSAYQIANDLDHHVYDSFYLAIPFLFGGVMVTADRKFYNKVKESLYGDNITWIGDT